jgi:hypothetical protein
MSRGLYGTAPGITFNSRLATKLVHAECTKILFNAMKAWVTSAKDSANRIPVWSGMALGSVKPVGDVLGISVMISPVASAFPRPGNRISDGVAAANFPKPTIIPGRYRFQWSSDVPHLAYNDQNDANQVGFHLTHEPRPWAFKVNADKAFEDEMNDGLKSFDWASLIASSLKQSNKSF